VDYSVRPNIVIMESERNVNRNILILYRKNGNASESNLKYMFLCRVFHIFRAVILSFRGINSRHAADSRSKWSAYQMSPWRAADGTVVGYIHSGYFAFFSRTFLDVIAEVNRIWV